jgi:hypothetical protein
MPKANSVKVILSIAVLFFVAKPFVGFTVFNRQHQPPQENIFVKVFSKRKLEVEENSKFSIAAIQKRLGQPLDGLLMFSAVLSLLIPFILSLDPALTYGFLRRRKLALQPGAAVYLLNGNLTI